MECLPVEKIPEGDNWTYELKLDGYRLEAMKAGGKVLLYSRRGIDLTKRFEYVAKALANLPDETVIDGELVALDEEANRASICSRTSGRLNHILSSTRSTSWFTMGTV
jgi:bifunctional non-homologous end joining protein LigD